MYTVLLGECSVSKKLMNIRIGMIMDQRQDSAAALTQAETCGPSAQDGYDGKSLGPGEKKPWLQSESSCDSGMCRPS